MSDQATTEPVEIEWRDVTKRFGAHLALDGFSMRVGAGVHALLGENGAGKSTALGILTAARRPTSGSVTIGGLPVRRGSRTAQLTGFAPQSLYFPETVRVREVLEFVTAHYPAPLRSDEVLDRVGLSSLARRQCGGLSGGEARRLGIACALVGDTPAVLLDEPSAGLDLPGQRLVQDLVVDLGARGRTVIVASHDLAEIERVADRIWVVSHGRVASQGSPDDVIAALGRTRVEFDAGDWDWRAALEAIDPGLDVESAQADARGRVRVRLTTAVPDEVGRRILAHAAAPAMNVTRPSLGEAVAAMLERGSSASTPEGGP